MCLGNSDTFSAHVAISYIFSMFFDDIERCFMMFPILCLVLSVDDHVVLQDLLILLVNS